MKRQVRRLEPALRDDFYRFHCERDGAGGCCCVAWWVPTWEGWSERTPAQNRAFRDELFARGEYDGYLLYVDGEPAGWCQVGRRDRLGKLVAQLGLAPDPSAWAVTCFEVAAPLRRQGHAGFLLGEVLADLKAKGVKRVEAFPKRGEGLEEGDLWNGPEALYLAAGFTLVRDDPKRPVLAIAW